MPSARLTGYLLGTLADDERHTVEKELLGDDEAFEELRAAEDDLIDAYVRGELPEDSRGRFEALFLADGERRERVRLARELQKAAAAPSRRRLVYGSVMAGVVAVAALLVVVVMPRPRPEAVASYRLAAPTRDSGTTDLELPAGAATLRLELELPAGAVGPGLGVRIRRAGGGALTGTVEAGPPFAVVVRAADLTPGSYLIELVRPDGAPAFYRFRVTSR